jgi:hypothetical protein
LSLLVGTAGFELATPCPHDVAPERHVDPAANEDTARTPIFANQNGLQPRSYNPLILLAEWTGLKPATPGVTDLVASDHLGKRGCLALVGSTSASHSRALALRSGVPGGESRSDHCAIHSRPPTSGNILSESGTRVAQHNNEGSGDIARLSLIYLWWALSDSNTRPTD